MKNSPLKNSQEKSVHSPPINQSPRECIKVREYKYEPEKSPKKQTKNKSDHIPIRSIVEKISSLPELAELNQKEKINMIMTQVEFYASKTSHVDMGYKKFITPRDTSYHAKPFMFDRYNYENYGNYEYKNPFKPTKYPIRDRIMKDPPKIPKRGTSKNLQIVFCETKYQDFVEKANKQVHQSYQSRSKSMSNLPQSTMRNLNTIRSKSQKKMKFDYNRPIKKKSTLANYLQQFNTLEKLSQYMEREHKLNEKFLFAQINNSKSNTVLIDILVHRFEFLKKMKKKSQQLLFKALLNLDEVPKYYKINIQDYLKFIQLFVYRDADNLAIAMFMFAFLFKESQQLSEQAANRSLGVLGGSAELHSAVEDRIKQILQSQNEGQKVFNAMKKDSKLLKMFIDLILAK